MNQVTMEESHQIRSTEEKILTMDPAVALPSEMLTHLLEMHCRNLELGEMKKFRLVSKAWRDALEKLWRKRVTVCLSAVTINDFRKIVEKPCFNYNNCPLKKFQIKLAIFTMKTSVLGVNEFWEICAESIKHLELDTPMIGHLHNFLKTILLKLINMETFCLIAPKTLSPEFPSQHAENLVNIKREKLTCLKLHLRPMITCQLEVNEFPYPLTCHQFLSSFPNLQQLEIGNEGPLGIDIGYNSFDHRQWLEAVKTLSLEGGLQHLKHLQIWRCEFSQGNESSWIQCVRHICHSTLPSLESLHVEIMLPFGRQENFASALPMVLEKFGSTLKRLRLNLPVSESQIFPLGYRLEKLENLSVSWDIAHFIRNAKYLPNLKSFSVYSTFCGATPSTATVIWQDDINNVTKIGLIPNRELEEELPRQIHNYDGSSEDNVVDEENENFQLRYDRFSALGFLFEGYKCLRGNFIFVNVTSLRLDFRISCTVFKKVPQWMPNVTTLEAKIAACAFPVVCDKWRNLEKLTLLHDSEDTRFSTRYDNFVPVDDCAIVGRKHLTGAYYRCSFAHTNAVENCAPTPSPQIKEEIPNITYLTHLNYFKMQIGKETKYNGKDFNLSYASAFHGFYKLPQLEYLEIIADLEPEIIQELFKRVPRCIVYQLRYAETEDDNDSNSIYRCPRRYFGMRNFSLGKF